MLTERIIALQSTLWSHYMESWTHATHLLDHKLNCAILDFRSQKIACSILFENIISRKLDYPLTTGTQKAARISKKNSSINWVHHIFPPMAKKGPSHSHINLQYPTIFLSLCWKANARSVSYPNLSNLSTRLIKSFPGLYLYFRTAPKEMDMRSKPSQPWC